MSRLGWHFFFNVLLFWTFFHKNDYYSSRFFKKFKEIEWKQGDYHNIRYFGSVGGTRHFDKMFPPPRPLQRAMWFSWCSFLFKCRPFSSVEIFWAIFLKKYADLMNFFSYKKWLWEQGFFKENCNFTPFPQAKKLQFPSPSPNKFCLLLWKDHDFWLFFVGL